MASGGCIYKKLLSLAYFPNELVHFLHTSSLCPELDHTPFDAIGYREDEIQVIEDGQIDFPVRCDLWHLLLSCRGFLGN